MDEPRLKLPPKVTRQVLEKHKRPGEPEVLMVAKGIGSTQPFELCDREGKSYTLLWDVKLDGHVLRFPWHVWMGANAKVALGLMEQRRMTFPLVILVEWEKEEEGVGGHRRDACAPCDEGVGGHRRDACAPCDEGVEGHRRDACAPCDEGVGGHRRDACAPCDEGVEGHRRDACAPCDEGVGGHRRDACAPCDEGVGGHRRDACAPCDEGVEGHRRDACAPCDEGVGGHRRDACAPCDEGVEGHRRDACAPYEEGAGGVRPYEELRRMLDGGAVRIKVAAAGLGVDEAALRLWLDEEEAPARLIQGGWVKLKS